MTYAEYRMQKVAEGDEENQPKNWYKDTLDQAEAGDETAKEVLARTPQSAIGWGLLGAGLGAGGGYILSRWLRRNGTKRQRALDMLIGALLGGGGAWLTLNSFKGPEGLTWLQQQAVDEYKRETGHGDEKSRPDPVETDPWRQGFRYGGAAIGGIGAGLTAGNVGKRVLPHWFEDAYLRRMAIAQGVDPRDKGAFGTWLAKEQYGLNGNYVGGKAIKQTDPAIRRRALDTMINAGVPGIVAGGLGAWGGAEGGEWLYDKLGLGHPDEGYAN